MLENGRDAAKKVLDSLLMTYDIKKKTEKKTQLAPGQLKKRKERKNRISTNCGTTRSHANNNFKTIQIPKSA